MLTISQIVSKVHALAAAYRALSDLLASRLKSRNVHSEIVFCLNPNNSVSSSTVLHFLPYYAYLSVQPYLLP